MITVTCAGPLPPGINRAKVVALARLACRRAGLRSRSAMSVNVIADARMRALNRAYRGKDKTTDVLSFAQDADARKGGGERDLGDLFISLPQVRRQAKRAGKPVADEFALMIVHGTLHLLGFDHETSAQERKMFGLQHDILVRAGIL